jgi:predicted nucleic acid-binding protein
LSQAGLEKRIAAGERVLIDTTVLVAYLGSAADDDTHGLAVHVVENMVQNGRNVAVVSPVTAMEVLVRPLKVSPPAAAHVQDFLTHTANMKLLPIDIYVAQEAASLRATHNFKTPDAFVIATGMVSQVHHLVTNDKEWRTKLSPLKNRIKVTMLRDYL